MVVTLLTGRYMCNYSRQEPNGGRLWVFRTSGTVPRSRGWAHQICCPQAWVGQDCRARGRPVA